jgi:hypothetical protein
LYSIKSPVNTVPIGNSFPLVKPVVPILLVKVELGIPVSVDPVPTK